MCAAGRVRSSVQAPVLGTSLFVLLTRGPTSESTVRAEGAEGAAGAVAGVPSLMGHL